MSKHLYKQISPHLQRISVDGGDPPININELLLLENSNILYKDYLKLAFCPELYGYKKDTRSGINYVTKGYSANSIQQELGPNLVLNGTNLVDSNSDGIADDFINDNSGQFLISTGNGFSGKYQQLSSNGVLYYQSSSIKIGFKYKVSFYYTSSGGCSLSTGANDIFLPVNTGQAKYYEIYLSNGNAQRLYIVSHTGSTLQIGNILLQEVLSNDLTQTSSANQPYLDKIAPAEKLSAKNPNGGSNYLTHPTISFGASDEWTLEFNYNCFGKLGNNAILGDTENTTKICLYNYGYLQIYGNGINWNTTYTTSRHIGKNTNVCITYKSGTTKVYIGGVLIDSISNINYPISLDRLFYGVYYWDFGSLYSYHIFSKALSASEIAERSAILRSIFPEIPFTRIGDQIWSVRNFEATVTPQGNLIPEIQSNGNVETRFNTGYSGTTDWIDSNSDGLADNMGAQGNTVYSIVTGNGFIGNAQRCVNTTDVLNTWSSIISISYNANDTTYKPIKVTVKYRSSKKIWFTFGGPVFNANTGNAITVSYYQFASQSSSVRCLCGFGENSYIGDWAEIDEYSVKEIGWSGSQELYDGIYAQTSGTVEQKTYAAVKAAAMWCHYNNDSALGAIYGKLYNWFAVKLLQMDIDYYNAANPTTPWGWRVPTQSDFSTLLTTLGGASVAGNSLKTTNYYASSIGTNTSGFSAIGNGARQADGSFNALVYWSRIYALDTSLRLDQGNTNCSFYRDNNIEGYGIRLIKV